MIKNLRGIDRKEQKLQFCNFMTVCIQMTVMITASIWAFVVFDQVDDNFNKIDTQNIQQVADDWQVPYITEIVIANNQNSGPFIDCQQVKTTSGRPTVDLFSYAWYGLRPVYYSPYTIGDISKDWCTGGYYSN